MLTQRLLRILVISKKTAKKFLSLLNNYETNKQQKQSADKEQTRNQLEKITAQILSK